MQDGRLQLHPIMTQQPCGASHCSSERARVCVRGRLQPWERNSKPESVELIIRLFFYQSLLELMQVFCTAAALVFPAICSIWQHGNMSSLATGTLSTFPLLPLWQNKENRSTCFDGSIGREEGLFVAITSTPL